MEKAVVPVGLSPLEYARHILENSLGWPAKGNIEMVGDCIQSISRSKQLPPHLAYGYLERAIRLAKEQGIEVDHYFFSDGRYTTVRPREERRYNDRPTCGGTGCESGWRIKDRRAYRCPECRTLWGINEHNRGGTASSGGTGAGKRGVGAISALREESEGLVRIQARGAPPARGQKVTL